MICILYEKLCQGIWSQSLLPFWSSTSSCQRQNCKVKHRPSIWGKRKKNNHPPLNTGVFEESFCVNDYVDNAWKPQLLKVVLPTGWGVVIATLSKNKPDRKLPTTTQTVQFFPLHTWSNLRVFKTKRKNKTQTNQTQGTVWNQSGS